MCGARGAERTVRRYTARKMRRSASALNNARADAARDARPAPRRRPIRVATSLPRRHTVHELQCDTSRHDRRPVHTLGRPLLFYLAAVLTAQHDRRTSPRRSAHTELCLSPPRHADAWVWRPSRDISQICVWKSSTWFHYYLMITAAATCPPWTPGPTSRWAPRRPRPHARGGAGTPTARARAPRRPLLST